MIDFSDHIVKWFQHGGTWFQSYLSNRKFTVNIQNSFSEISSISCGVPQGSILGPAVFWNYVHDMPMSINSSVNTVIVS